MVEYLKKMKKGNRFYYNRVARWINTKLSGGEFKILDLGCGNCEIGDKLAKLGHDVTFADVEKGRGDVIVCDMESKLPFDDNSFDLIICWNVIEHVKSFDWIFECHRILKNNGGLITLCPDWKSCHKRFYDTLTHFTPYTLRRLRELVKRTDFKIIELRYFANIPLLWKESLKSFEYNFPFKKKAILGVFRK